MGESVSRPQASRFEGCIVGLAIGDALGMPAEGLTHHEIRARWGRIRDFLPASDLAAGQYTDEAQIAVALAESIVQTAGFDPAAAAGALCQWWISGRARRPGQGTAEACERLMRGAAWEQAGSGSAGCGAAPRAAIIGLLDCRRADKLLDDAVASAIITHRDPRAVAGAVAVAAAVAFLVSAAAPLDVAGFLEHAAAACAPRSAEMAAAIRSIHHLLDLAPRKAMDELGYTGFALEAVPTSIYCFAAVPDDFAESVLLAANAGGDTDSIAAMTGALGGAHLGIGGIPPHWVEGVEESQRLRQLARGLHGLA